MSPRSETPREKIGLPPRTILYSLDQISTIINVPLTNLQKRYLYFENRSVGLRSPHLITTRNIAPPTHTPDWRVSEQELIRWLKFKGFRYYDRGYIK